MDAPFGQVISTHEALRQVYRPAAETTKSKKVGAIDELAARFIAASPFVVLSTASAEGRCDVSPRGGPAGFVKVIDEHRIVLPDLNGNNLLDSMENVVDNPHAGLIFMVPGRDETLRVNGAAYLSTDPELLGLFEGELRRPKSVLALYVHEAYVHCAKAFRRGGMWDPASWPALEGVPTGAAMLTCHIGLEDPPEVLEENLEKAYVWGLNEDKPEPAEV